MPQWNADDILLIDLPDGGALSGTSKALLVSASQTMFDRWQWDDMSDAQWDEIQALVSLAINEVIADV